MQVSSLYQKQDKRMNTEEFMFVKREAVSDFVSEFKAKLVLRPFSILIIPLRC